MTQNKIKQLEAKIEKLQTIIDIYDMALGDVSLMLCAIKDSDEANVTIRAIARAALCLSVNDKTEVEERMNDE